MSNAVYKDWAESDRKAFLASIPAPKKSSAKMLAPGVYSNNVFAQDFAGADRRSVKAQLAGRGDYRAAWWEFNRILHKLFKPQASLQEIMYGFHSRHHTMTLAFATQNVRLQEALDRTPPGSAIVRGFQAAVIEWKSRWGF